MRKSTMGEEDCFTRVCGHKAQTGVRMITDALRELEMSRGRSVLEQEALELAKKNLASVNLLINVVMVTDEKRRSFDA
jgi:hypothetical protein